MPSNNTELEKNLWDVADELRANSRLRAAVRLAIEDLLYERLPERYTGELCDQKRDDIYRHVYTSYWGAGRSVYAAA